jgi:hypothetical protein
LLPDGEPKDGWWGGRGDVRNLGSLRHSAAFKIDNQQQGRDDRQG